MTVRVWPPCKPNPSRPAADRVCRAAAGPLRNAQDPENAAFLADVNRGRMPAELMGPDGNPEGDVHIIDKSGEQYVPPKAKPFSGEGRIELGA